MTRRAGFLALALVVILALGACADLPLQLDPVDSVIREAVQASRAAAAEQKAVLAAAQEAVVSESSTANRLRLATLLVSLPPPLRDDARATELLEPIANPNGSGSGRLAAFLLIQVAERQRVARELDRVARELERLGKERATERAGLEKDRQERDKREEALKQQLEALRAIERGILDREDRLRKTPPVKP
jgi:hypothetical protein